jgi:quercetin dioxygenase-like cupin family protein
MSLDAQRLQALRAALTVALTLDESDVEAADEIANVRRLLACVAAAPVFPPEATRHPVINQMAPAIAATAERFPALASALQPISAELPWRFGYAARADLPALATRMGYTEIVGPLAPFRSHEVCLGLTFLAPHTFYPAHRHPAVELYRIVAGRPLWTVDSDTRQLAPPAIIVHRSGAAHAMASEDHALLAIYSWTGDIVSPSVWVS